MFVAKISPIWACAAVFALAVTACGDDTSGAGGGSTSGGGSSGDGGNGNGGEASSPSSSSSKASSSTGTPATNSASSGEGPGTGGSGPGTGGTGPGTGGTGPGTGGSGPGTGGNDPAGTGGNDPSGTGGGGTGGAEPFDCDDDAFLIDPLCDQCARGGCCDEIEACLDDVACADPDTGDIDPESDTGAAFLACVNQTCDAECNYDGVSCEAVLFQNPLYGFCVNESSCCDELVDCVGEDNGTACFDCLGDGGGGVCDDFLDCSDDEGCEDVDDPYAICGSLIGFFPDQDGEGGNYPLANCLENNCCAEFEACSGADPNDPDAVGDCIDCLLDGGDGALCEDAAACAAAECNVDLSQ